MPSELEENRAGRIHSSQRERGLARAEREVRNGVLLQVAGAVALLLPQTLQVFPRLVKDFDFTLAEQLEFEPKRFAALVFFGVLLATLPLLFGITVRREGLKAARAFRDGRVVCIDDHVQRFTRRSYGPVERCFAGGRVLSLGEVPWSAIDPSRRMRLYVLDSLDLVLSAEVSA